MRLHSTAVSGFLWAALLTAGPAAAATSGAVEVMGNQTVWRYQAVLRAAAVGTATKLAADQAAIGGLSTCDPTSVGLVADYHFDECSYNGSGGEARDSHGSYHATSPGPAPGTAGRE